MKTINNKNLNRFIHDIISDPGKNRNIDELSMFFSVSPRTIRNYCESMQKIMIENGLDPGLLEIVRNSIVYHGNQNDNKK